MISSATPHYERIRPYVFKKARAQDIETVTKDTWLVGVFKKSKRIENIYKAMLPVFILGGALISVALYKGDGFLMVIMGGGGVLLGACVGALSYHLGVKQQQDFFRLMIKKPDVDPLFSRVVERLIEDGRETIKIGRKQKLNLRLLEIQPV
jgi:hypothetical protein